MIYSKRFCGKSRTKQINIYYLVMKRKINSRRKHLRNWGREKEGKKRKVF